MKKYNIVYADPPWQYKVWSKKGSNRTAETHYNTMNIEDIKKINIQSICANDCVLFLWVTFPCLQDGLELIKTWGFTYKTNAFIWVKQNKKKDSLFWGMGYYTRANSEICLLASKGKTLPRLSKKVHSVILSKIEHHSKKPDIVRNKIVELFGDLPRVELFARIQTKGWDVFGNEVENSIVLI